jgi:hypothetical protein
MSTSGKTFRIEAASFVLPRFILAIASLMVGKKTAASITVEAITFAQALKLGCAKTPPQEVIRPVEDGGLGL